MNALEWKMIIKGQMSLDADCLKSFNTMIDILAEILEERDRVYKAYMEQGANPVIIFESDRGAKNPKQNPILKQWNELNATALAYMRDLGITPAGLRKLQGTLPPKTTSKGFSKLLDEEGESWSNTGTGKKKRRSA